MAYEHENKEKGKTYVLHGRETELKGGRLQTIYFFSTKGNVPKSGEPCEMPPGKEVGVNERTGLPFLRNA
jgi:hypothetical protein